MGMAALLCVREDRERADRLMEILREKGVDLDSSASAFERPADYEASVALFSPHAVKSALLVWAAQQALDARRLVPVYLSLTAIPKAFALTPIHDLHEWAGQPDHPAVTAIERHILRLQRSRSEHENLANLGRARTGVRLQQDAGPMLVEAMPPEQPIEAPRQMFVRAPARTLSEFETPAASISEEAMLSRWAAPEAPRQPTPEEAYEAASISAAARRRRLIMRERMLGDRPGEF